MAGVAVLLPVRTVGVIGDFRTYAQVIDVLRRFSIRITYEVKGVNRVVYDVSSKLPSTIEWE